MEGGNPDYDFPAPEQAGRVRIDCGRTHGLALDRGREKLTVSETIRALIVGHFLKSDPDGQNLEVRDRLAFLSVPCDEPPI